MRTALAAALLVLAACDFEPRGRCTADADCLDGQTCNSGVCGAAAPGPPAHAPVASADAYSVPSGTPFDCPAGAGVLANDSDPDGDPLAAEKVSDPTYGVVLLAPDGSFTYVPMTGYSGPDTFTYRASDGALRSAVTTVSITVLP